MHTTSTSMPAAPGAIIGYRKNGTPIRLIAGGNGEGDGATGQQETGNAASGPSADGGTAGDGAGAPDGQPRGEQEQAAGSGSSADGADPGRTDRTIAAIRQEFKDERAKRQAAEKRLTEIQAALDADKAERAAQMDKLAIALGVKSGDEPPDPARLAEELKAAREQAAAEISQRDAAVRQSQVELAVLRSAARHGANGDALLDSRSFMARVSGLDPAAESFGDDLADAIRSAVENGPQYKAVTGSPAGTGQDVGGAERKPPAPSRSGGEHTTPGGNRQWTIADVDAATPAEVVAAQEQGLLADLGYPPRRKTR